MPSNQSTGATKSTGKDELSTAAGEEDDSKRKSCIEQNHADDEEFGPRDFPFHELIPALARPNFNPNTKNAATGSVFDDSHHLKGIGCKTRKRFMDFNCCFCLEWEPFMVNGKTVWGRCLNMFNRESPGCCKHGRTLFKDGPNSVYAELAANRTCNWGMLKNKTLQAEQAKAAKTTVPTPGEMHAKAKKQLALLDEQIGQLDVNGEDTTDMELERVELMKRMSRLKKESTRTNHGTTRPPDGTKAMPATSTDGLRAPGAGANGGRRKGAKAPGGITRPELDAKSRFNPNTRVGQKAKVVGTKAKNPPAEEVTKCKKNQRKT